MTGVVIYCENDAVAGIAYGTANLKYEGSFTKGSIPPFFELLTNKLFPTSSGNSHLSISLLYNNNI